MLRVHLPTAIERFALIGRQTRSRGSRTGLARPFEPREHALGTRGERAPVRCQRPQRRRFVSQPDSRATRVRVER